MKKRWFIISPVYSDDFLWKVCSTTSKDSFLNVYHNDLYEEEKDFTEAGGIKAIEFARKKCGRAYII